MIRSELLDNNDRWLMEGGGLGARLLPGELRLVDPVEPHTGLVQLRYMNTSRVNK